MSKRKLPWTIRDMREAQAQGYDVFDYDLTGLLEINKLDESDKFKDDDDAVHHVIEQASRGCTTARRALALHVRDAWKLKCEFHMRRG